MMPKVKIIVFLLLALPFWADAQSFYAIRRERSLIVTAGLGNASYFGELKNPKDYLDTKFNITGGLQYFVDPRVSIRTELTYFQLKGSDAESNDESRVRRNLSFTSGNFELSVTGAVSLAPIGSRFYQRPPLNFYAFAGIGLLYSNPKAELDGKKHALQPLQTEGVKYGKFHPVVPVGLGARIKINPFFNMAIEGGYRITFTDYLDDVSTVHPDKSTWTDPVRIALSDRRSELGLTPYAPGTQRGNPDKNDGYFLLNVKVEYYLPRNFLFNDNQRKLYNQQRKANYRRR